MDQNGGLAGGGGGVRGQSLDIAPLTNAAQESNRALWALQQILLDIAALPFFSPGLVASSTYTPTLTNVANVTASTAFVCQYMRVVNVVTVSGKVNVDPTAALATQLGISLPIASNIANNFECAGTAAAPAVAGQCAAIVGDAANNRAEMQWVAVDLAARDMFFTFSYLVI